MNSKELLEKMKALKEAMRLDSEALHVEMDNLLLEYVNDPEVTNFFNSLNIWYA